ncbi:ABC transporter, ATP-binding protein [Eubacterium saphenum ATCC 49989]|nr:ABC transporter, ATP-binding protein [Eubacterium saphenum ATCC 49989]
MENVNYSYEKMNKKVLRNVSVDFEEGTMYAIVGNSGEGKSTMLGILAGLDVPSSGKVKFNGEDITVKGYSYHRQKQISLVFQNYNLIDYMTPIENLRLVNPTANEDILLDLGLSKDEITRNVMKLSGGQQQRVAIGRALVSDAPVILADEPTGNLDEKTARDIIALLKKIAHEDNKCVVVVTHSKKLAGEADQVLTLKKKDIVIE